MLALPALAVLLVCACADAAGRVRGGACGRHTTPMITINVRSPPSDGAYTLSYGENIILHCSAEDAQNLNIHKNGKSMQKLIKQINITTIQLIMEKPNLGEYIYSCKERKNRCESYLNVEVEPAMSVESSKAYHKINDGLMYVFVPLGENYTVFCSGNDAGSLRMHVNKTQFPTEDVNKTTIMHVTQADHVHDESYWCSDEKEAVVQVLTVNVDYYPEGVQFWCFIGAWTTLECSWDYSGDIDTFKLFYRKGNDGEAGTLCFGSAAVGSDTCEWIIGSQSFFKNENVSFTLEVCNEYVCNNQKFSFKIHSITKLNSISALRVLETSSQNVLLQWESLVWGHFGDTGDYFVCETWIYRVEYRMKAVKEKCRQAASSSIKPHCDDQFCRFRIFLPYPNSQYEVKVFVRFLETTDKLWSDPELVFVSTKARVECPCGTASGLQKPAATVSSETLSCEVCKLTDDTIQGNLGLKNKIKALREKLAKINEMSKLLSKSKEIASKLNRLVLR